MASPSDLAGMIQPGSTQYGDRQNLEAGLGQAFGGGGAAPAPNANPVTPLPSAVDPLGMLLGGDMQPDGSPLTAGLSVGPGPGPMPKQVPDDMSQRLTYLAQYAQTPMLRYLARQALRQRYLSRGR